MVMLMRNLDGLVMPIAPIRKMIVGQGRRWPATIRALIVPDPSAMASPRSVIVGK
jgi:hypothetical protein